MGITYQDEDESQSPSKFPSYRKVGSAGMKDLVNCADYEHFFITPQGRVGTDWKLSIRLDLQGRIGKPVYWIRDSNSQNRGWDAAPHFLPVPEDVKRKAATIARNIRKALKVTA